MGFEARWVGSGNDMMMLHGNLREEKGSCPQRTDSGYFILLSVVRIEHTPIRSDSSSGIYQRGSRDGGTKDDTHSFV